MRNRRLVNVTLGLLILQFVLGMLANFYSEIPAQKPVEVFHQFGFIMFHVLNAGALLVLGSILVAKSRKQPGFKLALGGLINLVLAFGFGEAFVFTQKDVISLFMALAFIGALMSYARLVFSGTSTSGPRKRQMPPQS